MRRNVRNNRQLAKGLVGQLAAEKKKAVTALCMIGVMTLLWIRVLTKKAPEAAGAEIAAEPLKTKEQLNPEFKISFIELPKVAGRNDVINRDVFASENWRHFIEKQSGIGEVNVLSQNGNEEAIRKMAEKLNVEAIMISGSPRAYVNGTLIEMGDKMLIGEGMNKFVVDVVAIEENTVVIKCKEAKIRLKLEQETTKNN